MKLKELKQIKLKGGDKKIMKTEIKQERGITLIALVVTIVVLLILAGVSVNALFRDSGVIEKAKEAQNKMDEAQQKDLNSINELNNWLENQVNGKTTGENDNPTTTTTKISTLIGTVVDKNTKAEDAYGNKITIPKGFKVLANGTSTESATYSYSGDNIPAVQDGIVIEHGTDKNQFVWVPVGTIKNKNGSTNTITLGRYSDFTMTNGAVASGQPVQNAKDYSSETVIKIGKKENYTVAKLSLQSEIKPNKAIQLEVMLDNTKVIPTAGDLEGDVNYKELTTFNSATDSTAQNATARNLAEFISTSLANGGYYIARFEASQPNTKIESKYNQTVLTDITQPNAAKLAREMYGEVKQNNELVYASDLVNSYAWDTAIIFIQTYSGKIDYASYNESETTGEFTATGENNDKYCNIWDMSGNAHEWTTEHATSSRNPCVYRGGFYNTDYGGAGFCASNRGFTDTTDFFSSGGLRTLLYVK